MSPRSRAGELDGPQDTATSGGGEQTTAAGVPRFLEIGAAWAWRGLVVAAALFVALRVASVLRFVVVPVFLALVVAALLEPLVGFVARALPRLAATWLVIVGATLAVLGTIALASGPVVTSARDLVGRADEARDRIRDWLTTGPLELSDQQVDDIFERVADTAQTAVSGFADSPTSTATLAAEFVGAWLLSIVLTFFFMKDGREMWTWIVQHLRAERREPIDDAGRAAVVSLRGWIRGSAITGVADATLIGLALWVLGVPAALPLAVLTFFAAFLPIVGATLAGALAAGVALADSGPQTAIIVVIVVIVVQQVEGDVLLPVVMYRQVALHPAVILVALAVGAAVGGLVGALVAVPVTAAATAAGAAIRSHAAPSDVAPSDVAPSDAATEDTHGGTA